MIPKFMFLYCYAECRYAECHSGVEAPGLIPACFQHRRGRRSQRNGHVIRRNPGRRI